MYFNAVAGKPPAPSVPPWGPGYPLSWGFCPSLERGVHAQEEDQMDRRRR